MTTITHIPRTTVRLGIAAARLPLTTAEAALRRSGDEAWPPALAFEAVEAHVEQVLGSLLRDERLADDGRVRAAKVGRIREAVTLEAEADLRREQAEETFEERRARAEREREEAERAEVERKAQVAQDEAAAEAAAEEAARAKAGEAAEANRKARRAAQRQARRSKAQALAAEERALTEEKAASARTRDAETADARVEASKARRRATT